MHGLIARNLNKLLRVLVMARVNCMGKAGGLDLTKFLNAGQDLGLDRLLWKSNVLYWGFNKCSQSVRDAAN